MVEISRTDLGGFPGALEALDSGADWSYVPEGIATDGVEWPCQSGSGWYRTWTFNGVEVSGGVAYLSSWSLDEGGSFEFNGEAQSLSEELAENDTAWSAYASYVAETGVDPLGNFTVPRSYVTEEVWQFKALSTIPGLLFQGVRRGGRGPWLTGSDVPSHVRFFLSLRMVGNEEYVANFTTPADAKARAGGIVWQRAGSCQVKGTFTLTRKKDRTPAALSRDLKKAARSCLLVTTV